MLVKVALSHLNFKMDSIDESMQSLNWPGRMQHIEPMSWGGSLFVDAAHNPSGLKRVLPSITERVASKMEWCLVFGCTPQDDLDAFVQPLLDLCKKHPPSNILLTVPQTGRYPGVPLSELRRLDWSCEQAIIHAPTPHDAKTYLEQIQPEYTLAIGSLYLIGELFEALSIYCK
jgi:folylpolyglutamate synthase/dihydropteroate synthase